MPELCVRSTNCTEPCSWVELFPKGDNAGPAVCGWWGRGRWGEAHRWAAPPPASALGLCTVIWGPCPSGITPALQTHLQSCLPPGKKTETGTSKLRQWLQHGFTPQPMSWSQQKSLSASGPGRCAGRLHWEAELSDQFIFLVWLGSLCSTPDKTPQEMNRMQLSPCLPAFICSKKEQGTKTKSTDIKTKQVSVFHPSIASAEHCGQHCGVRGAGWGPVSSWEFSDGSRGSGCFVHRCSQGYGKFLGCRVSR